MTRHVLPNSMAPVLVYGMVSVGTAIVAETALSFLGVGVKPDIPDWGNMIAAGRQYLGYLDYLWIFPSLAVVFTVLGFVFVGDGLRDALDPRLALTCSERASRGGDRSSQSRISASHFHTDAGVVKAVDGGQLVVAPGRNAGHRRRVGLRASRCRPWRSWASCRQPPARIPSGRILFRGRDLLTASEDELRALRGNEISMIFQDPLTALNPVFKVGHQIAEVIRVHEKIGGSGPQAGRRPAGRGRHPQPPRSGPRSIPTSSPAGCASER